MNLSGHLNDNIKALVTPSVPSTTSMGLSTNDELPISYGSETDPVFTAWLAAPVGLTKSHVGLGNVDNTSDLSKPLSTAMTNALALKQDVANLSTNLTTDAASTTKYPACKTVKDYADAITIASAALYQTLANLSTNTSLGSSDTLYPSQKAVKTYVDARIPVGTAHNNTSGKEASVGATEWYHLTQAQHTIAVQSATAARDGYLTKEDFSLFTTGSGGVATSLKTTNFEMKEVSNRLVIIHNGTATEIFSFSTAGLEKTKDDLVAFTTP